MVWLQYSAGIANLIIWSEKLKRWSITVNLKGRVGIHASFRNKVIHVMLAGTVSVSVSRFSLIHSLHNLHIYIRWNSPWPTRFSLIRTKFQYKYCLCEEQTSHYYTAAPHEKYFRDWLGCPTGLTCKKEVCQTYQWSHLVQDVLVPAPVIVLHWAAWPEGLVGLVQPGVSGSERVESCDGGDRLLAATGTHWAPLGQEGRRQESTAPVYRLWLCEGVR